MTYIIVEEGNPQDLVNAVNEAIKVGFTPLGGVSQAMNKDLIYYVQAMVNDNPTRVISEEFKLIEKGIVPGEKGPEYVFKYQMSCKEHTVNLGSGLRNYSDSELYDIALARD